MTSRRKKETQTQKATKKILERKGIDYNQWKKDMINKRKLIVMSDEDKKWTEQTLKEEEMKLIMDEVINGKKINDIN